MAIATGGGLLLRARRVMESATDRVMSCRPASAIALGTLVFAGAIVGCGSSSSQTTAAGSQTSPATTPTTPASASVAVKSCQGTAANGYLKHLQVKIVSCTAGKTVMVSYARVFLENGSRPPAVVHVQGFSCVTRHPNGDTRIDGVVCNGTGDNSLVTFGGRSKLPLPSG
jgi:streptogramin lyase